MAKLPPEQVWLQTHFYNRIYPVSEILIPDAARVAASGVDSGIFKDYAARILMRSALGYFLQGRVSFFQGYPLEQKHSHLLLSANNSPSLGFDHSGYTGEPYTEPTQYKRDLPVIGIPLDYNLLGVNSLIERLGQKDFVAPNNFIKEFWALGEDPDARIKLRGAVAKEAARVLSEYRPFWKRFNGTRLTVWEMSQLV